MINATHWRVGFRLSRPSSIGGGRRGSWPTGKTARSHPRPGGFLRPVNYDRLIEP